MPETVYLFGSSEWKRGEEWVRIRSKVAVSWAYRAKDEWEVRGFVWIPDDKIASRAWKVVTDPEGWQKVLPWGTAPEVIPGKTWREQSTKEIVAFLHQTGG